MKIMLKSLSVGVLSLASLGALSTPAIAASLTGATIGGSASNDYLIYGVNGSNQTVVIPNTSNPSVDFANVQSVLTGNATSPTGNVELRASSEQAGFTTAEFAKNTSLSGAIGGKKITLSSLTALDWATTDYNGSGKTFGRYWFDSVLAQALTINNTPVPVNFGAGINNSLFNAFVTNKGFQRFSDPNISYVNQNTDGLVSIGLAGHYNALSVLFSSNTISALPPSVQPVVQAVLSRQNLLAQVSEVVKYSYDDGKQSGYLFSFKATNSGLVALNDGRSHTGNYEVTFQGAKPVPVPAGFVGIALAGAIGGGMLKRRKPKNLHS
jgi:hypothetical protein